MARRGDAPRPEGVGVLALEVYWPRQKVSMVDMEVADGCPGKYTVGLGQEEMAFASDREDAVSMALTVAHSLLAKYKVSPEEIGHLQVASESCLDRSKSIKSHLMQLFTCGLLRQQQQQESLAAAGSTSTAGAASTAAAQCSPRSSPGRPLGPPAEGTDLLHACYGGTAAVLAAAAWVESRRWDGRLALVVASDVALYAPGSAARATGGCGAAAVLVGPHAPLVLDPLWHGSHAEHAYDFYKPLEQLPYPSIDGPLTLTQYLAAAGHCALRVAARLEAEGELVPGEGLLPHVAHYVGHAPLNKLCRKGLARVALMDELRAATATAAACATSAAAPAALPSPASAAAAAAASGDARASEAPAAAAAAEGAAAPNGGGARAAESAATAVRARSGAGAKQQEAARVDAEAAAPTGPTDWVQEWVREEQGGVGPSSNGSGRDQLGAAATEVPAGPAGPRLPPRPSPPAASAPTHHTAAGVAQPGGQAASGAAAGSVGGGGGSGERPAESSSARGLRTDLGLADSLQALPSSQEFAGFRLEDKALEARLGEACSPLYARLGADSAWLQKQLGNSYTASVWHGLASLVSRVGADLAGRRVLLFSFGSGTVASMFSLVGAAEGGAEGSRGPGAATPVSAGGAGTPAGPGTATGSEGAGPSHASVAAAPTALDARFTLAAMQRALDLPARLSRRVQRPVAHFNAVATQVEAAYRAVPPYEPAGDLEDVEAGSYYLAHVDALRRRVYRRKEATHVC